MVGLDDARRAALSRIGTRFKDDQILLLGAGVAFYGLLSLVPALIAAVSVYGLVSDPADVTGQVERLAGSLPDAAKELLAEQLDAIARSSGASLSLGAVIGVTLALFSASTGINQLIGALGVAFRVEETRGALRLRLLSLVLTVAAVVVLGVALGAIAVVPALTSGTALEGAAGTAVSLARWPVLLAVFAVSLSALYRVGPDRPASPWRWLTRGAVTATVLWVLGSAAFSFYASNFASYNRTYGSLAGVVVLMLWLLLSSVAVLLGALVDAEVGEDLTRGTRPTSDAPSPSAAPR
jgi:membrane protein